MQDINEQEEHLGFQVSEFPKIDEAKVNIKPYNELWNLIRDQKVKLEDWNGNNIFDLDPEIVEKDHKIMFNMSNRLMTIFNNMKLPKPAKLAEQVKNNLFDFKPNLPIIRALCNAGLARRHWKEIHKQTEIEIDKAKGVTLHLLISYDVTKYTTIIEDISDTAYKEY